MKERALVPVVYGVRQAVSIQMPRCWHPASGQIVLNGSAARLGKPGNRITIMNFTEIDLLEADACHPRVIVLGKNNLIVNERGDLT